jgi:hypothetical protein
MNWVNENNTILCQVELVEARLSFDKLRVTNIGRFIPVDFKIV